MSACVCARTAQRATCCEGVCGTLPPQKALPTSLYRIELQLTWTVSARVCEVTTSYDYYDEQSSPYLTAAVMCFAVLLCLDLTRCVIQEAEQLQLVHRHLFLVCIGEHVLEVYEGLGGEEPGHVVVSGRGSRRVSVIRGPQSMREGYTYNTVRV